MMFLKVFCQSILLCRWLTTKSSHVLNTILKSTPKPPPVSQFSPSHLFCFVFLIQWNGACWSPDETEWRRAAAAPLGRVGDGGGLGSLCCSCKSGVNANEAPPSTDSISLSHASPPLLSLSLPVSRSWGYAAILAPFFKSRCHTPTDKTVGLSDYRHAD